MKLQLSSLAPQATQSTPRRISVPALTCSAQRGVFSPNAALTHALDLRVGQLVALEYDKADPRHWYLFRPTALSGYRLTMRHNKAGLEFFAKTLRRELEKHLPGAQGLLTLKLAEEPVTTDQGIEAWPLLTAPYWYPAP